MADDSQFGKYQLIAELGHGGMADVFLAVVRGPTGLGFSKLVVIKRLRPNLREDPEFVAMLIDEARIAARLNHPNVVQTTEVGQVGPDYFIAMEFLEGQPLHRIQQRAKTMPSGGIDFLIQCRILVDVLAGLHHAHELSDYDGTPLEVVHRDVSPHNIFVTYDGQVKVVDFGVAKAVGRASETRTGVVKGKIGYMAPEQAIGNMIDRRADVFSVGVMLWEAATGRRMWKGEQDIRVMHRLISGDIPRSPRAVNPDVPEAIDGICMRALAVHPEERYASAADFQQELEAYIATTGRNVTAREIGKLVTDLHQGNRDELKAILEAKLGELRSASNEPFTPAKFLTSPLSASHSSLSGTMDPSVKLNEATSATLVGPSNAQLARRRGTGVRTAALVGLGMTIALGGIWLVNARHPSSAIEQPAAAESAGVPSAVPTVEHVAITLRAAPPEARFSIDDGPLLENPMIIHVPKDMKQHRVNVQALGYSPRTKVLAFTEDVVIDLVLERLPEEKKAPPPVRAPPQPPATAKAAPPGKPKRQIDTDLPWP